jgi:hypothetical protein
MNELKRVPTKYVRDRAKARYVKASACYICGSTESLDFHHYYSVSTLIANWMAKEKVSPEDVLEWRDQFIAEHEPELYDFAVTLCNRHHKLLHSIYGQEPALFTAKKQERWVDIQRQKHGMV